MDDDLEQKTAVHGCEAISNDRPVSGANRRPRRSLLMKRNRKRVFAAILAVCALAAGGAAFTAGISSVPASAVAGFAQTQITGAEASSVQWNISSDGQYVNSVVLHLTSDGS